MRQLLTEVHRARHEEFKAFVAAQVEPAAAEWDRSERLPKPVLAALGERGYLGTTIAREYGGRGWDAVSFGLLNEALGRASAALTGVLTVQAMVAMALQKWGSAAQRSHWLPKLASGQAIGAIALTEPGGGSDLQGLATTFAAGRGERLRLNGRKKWISCAQFAGVFLVFGKLDDQPVACLVPAGAPGLTVEPIRDLMAFRAAGLAELHFHNVEVPLSNVVGKPGFALTHVAPLGLHYGRISTACSALGLLRGCCEETIAHAAARRIGAGSVGDIGMVRSLIAGMAADLEAATHLCHNACRSEDERLPEAYEQALIAKYFTSRAAVKAAGDAVQVRGASGVHATSPVSRYYRDAKVMEIIEGTTQIHEDILARMLIDRAGRAAAAPRKLPAAPQAAPQAARDDLARIAEFNRTDAAFPDRVTVQELIEAQVAARPTATAVICDQQNIFGVTSLTFGELNEKVNQVAHALRARGVRPGDIVALMVERSFAMIIGVLGIIKAGGAYLPVPPDNPADRIDYMLKDGGVKLLLMHTRTAGRYAFPGLTLDLDDPQLYSGPATNPENVNRPDDLAYVIYTSGSTGRPKGVMIEHRALVNRLNWMQQAYPIGESDVILQKTPYYFDVSVWELFWWALQGARLAFLMPGGERNPLAIVETIRKHRVSVMHFVPSMLNIFLEYLDARGADALTSLASVRRVFASGEALAASHVRKFNDIVGSRIGARLTNLYGPTEATVDVSYYDCPTANDFETIPIGRPIQNIRLYVIRDGRQAAVGEPGELCIAGVGLARGYLNNPALTAEKFTDNPVQPGERIYRTGDVARWLPDGNIEYLGREDHQVKIRGLRIELGEIENTLRGHPDVADCVAVVKKYSESVTLIIAYVVGRARLDVDGLKQYLRTRLPDYMIPSRFEPIAAIPLTPTGKADRKALPEPVLKARA